YSFQLAETGRHCWSHSSPDVPQICEIGLAAQRIVSTYQNGTWVINEHFKARLEPKADIQWQFARSVHRSRRVARFDWRIWATRGPDGEISAKCASAFCPPPRKAL